MSHCISQSHTCMPDHGISNQTPTLHAPSQCVLVMPLLAVLLMRHILADTSNMLTAGVPRMQVFRRSGTALTGCVSSLPLAAACKQTAYMRSSCIKLCPKHGWIATVEPHSISQPCQGTVHCTQQSAGSPDECGVHVLVGTHRQPVLQQLHA